MKAASSPTVSPPARTRVPRSRAPWRWRFPTGVHEWHVGVEDPRRTNPSFGEVVVKHSNRRRFHPHVRKPAPRAPEMFSAMAAVRRDMVPRRLRYASRPRMEPSGGRGERRQHGAYRQSTGGGRGTSSRDHPARVSTLDSNWLEPQVRTRSSARCPYPARAMIRRWVRSK